VTLFADQSRDALRATWREAWRKWRERVPMQALEAQIADVIAAHPEYQPLLQSDAALQQDFAAQGGRDNPFLHMGCIWRCTNSSAPTVRPESPPFIGGWSQALASEHAAEHRMIEVLAGVLWEAQRAGGAAEDAAYLERLRRL
jgi:hypothetical protein